MCTVGGRIEWIVTRSDTARRPGIPGTTTTSTLLILNFHADFGSHSNRSKIINYLSTATPLTHCATWKFRSILSCTDDLDISIVRSRKQGGFNRVRTQKQAAYIRIFEVCVYTRVCVYANAKEQCAPSGNSTWHLHRLHDCAINFGILDPAISNSTSIAGINWYSAQLHNIEFASWTQGVIVSTNSAMMSLLVTFSHHQISPTTRQLSLKSDIPKNISSSVVISPQAKKLALIKSTDSCSMNCPETFIICRLLYLRTPKTKNLISLTYEFVILRFLLTTREKRWWTRFAIRAIWWFKNDRLRQVPYFPANLLALPADFFGGFDKVCITEAFLLRLLSNWLISKDTSMKAKDTFVTAYHILLLISCPNHAIIPHTQYFLLHTFSWSKTLTKP